MSLLLCFSGQIGSGKSSVSTVIAEALGWRRTGFGEYLRSEIARVGGDPNDRKALQDLGQKRVDKDPTAFCRDVLSAGSFMPGDDFVIDGVRHVRIFEILTEVSTPSQARLLFLGALQTTRLARVEARADARDFARASTHRVEAELHDALPQRADGIVNADQSLDHVVSDCLELIRHWQQKRPSTDADAGPA
jgi:dephospho-CoA kinase